MQMLRKKARDSYGDNRYDHIFVKNARTTIEEKLIRSSILHDNKYDYSKTIVPLNCNERMEIICPEHGSFWQMRKHHFAGHGCPSCNKCIYYSIDNIEQNEAFFKNKIGKLYVIKCTSEDESFYKVGITLRDISKRIKEFTKYYEVQVIYIQEESIKELIEIENIFLNSFESKKYTPLIKFKGRTECLSVNPLDHYYNQ